MNSAPSSRPWPLRTYLLPIAVISPSLIWIVLDKSVWTWDPALYGKNSVELFFDLIYAPTDWISQMLDVLRGAAPGVSWFGQFFVPLGYLLGSIDVGLLLSIWVTQAFTLILMYRSVWELSGHNQLVSVTGSLVIGSAPLFVGMSHQYFAEPLQLLGAAWFLMIMSFAPQWNRAVILTQLLIATPVAMLAKASSPLYCLGPGLVALWYVFKPGQSSAGKREWLQKGVVGALPAGIVLSVATIAWYYWNITYVMQHISVASSGPIAELYGKKDSFLDAMLYWLGAIQNAFFLPMVLLISGLIFGFGVVRYFVNSKTQTQALHNMQRNRRSTNSAGFGNILIKLKSGYKVSITLTTLFHSLGLLECGTNQQTIADNCPNIDFFGPTHSCIRTSSWHTFTQSPNIWLVTGGR